MKKTFDLFGCLHPTIIKLFMELKIVFLIIAINVSIGLALSGNSSIPELQQKRISGMVTDKNGAPLPGVNVVIRGTALGAITDIEGKYSLEIPPEARSLTFSFIGMEPQQITI